MQTNAVSLKRYLNLTNSRLSFTNIWGRTQTMEPNRGGHFAPCEDIAKLIKLGMVEEVIDARLGRVDLPFSTQRRIPL